MQTLNDLFQVFVNLVRETAICPTIQIEWVRIISRWLSSLAPGMATSYNNDLYCRQIGIQYEEVLSSLITVR